MAATSYIAGKYPRDATMACTYFSTEVARIHVPDQVAGQTNRRKRCGIYSADSSGRSRGHFDNRRRGRGQVFGRISRRGRGGSGQSSRDSGGMSDFNDIDISDPTRTFNEEEWTAIDTGNGRAHITQQRMMINRRGRGCDAGKGGRGRDIDAVETGAEQEHVDEAANKGLSGRNGVRFGRGGYRT